MAENWLSNWENAHNILDCDNCDATYLHPKDQRDIVCPLCGEAEFSEVESDSDVVLTVQPEYVVPFAKGESNLQNQLTAFKRSLRLAPRDCTVENLLARATPFYWPMWLVDNDVTARWQAEVGFDYDAVTYREQYKEGEWRSMQNKERRIRWEPRLGELKRHYADHSAPALDEHGAIIRLIGEYDLKGKRPFTPQQISNNLIRLPVRTTQDAWPDAEPTILKSAARECQEASGAQHIRHFKWSPQFANANWTQLLLPMMATYYFDDEGTKKMVYLHGQTGKLVGQRRASMTRALRISRWLALGVGIVGLITAVLWLIQSMMGTNFNDLIGLLYVPIFFLVVGALIPPTLVVYLNNLHFTSENQQIKGSLHQSSEAYWGS